MLRQPLFYVLLLIRQSFNDSVLSGKESFFEQ